MKPDKLESPNINQALKKGLEFVFSLIEPMSVLPSMMKKDQNSTQKLENLHPWWIDPRGVRIFAILASRDLSCAFFSDTDGARTRYWRKRVGADTHRPALKRLGTDSYRMPSCSLERLYIARETVAVVWPWYRFATELVHMLPWSSICPRRRLLLLYPPVSSPPLSRSATCSSGRFQHRFYPPQTPQCPW